MKFYLMRHGEAESFAPSDAERALTEGGKREVIQLLKRNQLSLTDIDFIIHSPFLRACQTASLAAHALEIKQQVISALWLPEASPQLALQTLEQYTDKTPLIVTHMPLISLVEALCCEGDQRYPSSFSCGELSVIECDWPAAGLGTRLKRLN